jgi:hypothetical protein
MYSKCIVDPLMSTPIAIRTSYGRVGAGLACFEAVGEARLESEVDEAEESRSVAGVTSEPSREVGERVLEPAMILPSAERP